MRTHDRYMLSLTATYAATTLALAVYGTTLDLYLSVFIVEYFVITLLHSPFNAKTQRITNVIGFVLFGVFLLIVALRVLQILGVPI